MIAIVESDVFLCFNNLFTLLKVWAKRAGIFKQKSLLVMDSAKCHLTDAVKKALKKSNTDVKYVPGGMTPILQTLDTHLNRPIKDFVYGKCEDCILNGEQVNNCPCGDQYKKNTSCYCLFFVPINDCLLSGVHQIWKKKTSFL